jgi:hypothetical protein
MHKDKQMKVNASDFPSLAKTSLNNSTKLAVKK